jgi:hypothetical protein
MIRIEHNTETGEMIEVEMTKSEIDELKKDNAMIQQRAAEQLTKAELKTALLTRLGVTNEELAILLT